jgi:hypothetical protein
VLREEEAEKMGIASEITLGSPIFSENKIYINLARVSF